MFKDISLLYDLQFIYNFFMENQEFIDIHAHLDDEKFTEDRWNILKQFLVNMKSMLITVADPYSDQSWSITKKMLDQYPMLHFMIAAHPHQASSYTPSIEKRILSLLNHTQLVGIGEAGLDYHYAFSPPSDQMHVFQRQISIAKEVQLPILIHSRKAEKEILKTIEECKFSLPVIFHCYTGNLVDAQEIIKRNYYISFSGIITFKKADELKNVLRQIPLNRLFMETDSPYLSPEPFRGRTNSPLNIPIIYKKTSEILCMDLPNLKALIRTNYERLFGSNSKQ